MTRIAALARSFPSLRSAPGLDPWEPDGLDAWATGPEPGSGALYAARFVLALWSGYEWRSGHFDVVAAVAAWDQRHRRAFLTWAAEPWWP